MKKSDIWSCKRTCRRHCHGTRTVLIEECTLPTGKSKAAEHLQTLAELLLSHAERTYLPQATKELELMVENGRGYAFTPITVRIFSEIQEVKWGVQVTLSLQCTQGDTPLSSQSAVYLWSADGLYQQPVSARKKSRRRSHEARDKSPLPY